MLNIGRGTMTPGQTSEPGGGPYFFLSYAHAPKRDRDDQIDPDRWVAKLYNDLCDDIIELSAVGSEYAGFMDRQMGLGTDWRRRLALALGTCRVFVPLYSPRYFQSEQCGREWFAFRKRCVDFGMRHGREIDAIVPALWVVVPSDEMPSVASKIQFEHQNLGSTYSKEGFYGLIKLGRYKDEYQEAVYQLARHIIDVAKRTQVAPIPPVDYNSVPSAFGSDDARRMADKRIQITVAAPDKRNLPAGRSDFYYGATSREWNPYRDDFEGSLAEYTSQLTSSLGFEPFIVTLNDYTADPAGAVPSSGPNLLLVDPWQTVSVANQQLLRDLDEHAKPCVSLMVPWNHDDAETMNAKEQLKATLGQSLSKLLKRILPEYQMAGTGIPTLKDFGDMVAPLATDAGRKYLLEADTYPPSGPHKTKPRLIGPHNPEPGDL
jgi:FxsC-like protein